MSSPDSLTARLDELASLISAWPGLSADADLALVEDSLVLLPFLEGATKVADVGSGGGLPGLALAIARPDLDLTLIESNHRKSAFLVSAAARLGLDRVEVVTVRAEQAGHTPQLRERFDAVTARAVAPMAVLAELCLPLAKLGGRVLAMKAGADDEVRAALPAISELGGLLVTVAQTPSSARSRGQVVVVEKVSQCPPLYPRRPGVPERRPLGIREK